MQVIPPHRAYTSVQKREGTPERIRWKLAYWALKHWRACIIRQVQSLSSGFVFKMTNGLSKYMLLLHYQFWRGTKLKSPLVCFSRLISVKTLHYPFIMGPIHSSLIKIVSPQCLIKFYLEENFKMQKIPQMELTIAPFPSWSSHLLHAKNICIFPSSRKSVCAKTKIPFSL